MEGRDQGQSSREHGALFSAPRAFAFKHHAISIAEREGDTSNEKGAAF